jgi:hypothetical protein
MMTDPVRKNQTSCSHAKASSHCLILGPMGLVTDDDAKTSGTHRPAGRVSTETNEGQEEIGEYLEDYVTDILARVASMDFEEFDGRLARCVSEKIVEFRDSDLEYFSRRCFRDRYEFGKWPEKKLRVTTYRLQDRSRLWIDWNKEDDMVVAKRLAQKCRAKRVEYFEQKWHTMSAGIRFLKFFQVKTAVALEHKTERQKKDLKRPKLTKFEVQGPFEMRYPTWIDYPYQARRIYNRHIRGDLDGRSKLAAYINEMNTKTQTTYADVLTYTNNEEDCYMGDYRTVQFTYEDQGAGQTSQFRCTADYRLTARYNSVTRPSLMTSRTVQISSWHSNKKDACKEACMKIMDAFDSDGGIGEDEQKMRHLILMYFGPEVFRSLCIVEDMNQNEDDPYCVIYTRGPVALYAVGRPHPAGHLRTMSACMAMCKVIRDYVDLHNVLPLMQEVEEQWVQHPEDEDTPRMSPVPSGAMEVQGEDMGLYVAATGTENFRMKLMEDAMLLFAQIMSSKGNNYTIVLAGVGFLKLQAHNINKYLMRNWVVSDYVEVVVEAIGPALPNKDEAKDQVREWCNAAGLGRGPAPGPDLLQQFMDKSKELFTTPIFPTSKATTGMQTQGFSMEELKKALDGAEELAAGKAYKYLIRFFSYIVGVAMWSTSGEFSLAHFGIIDRWIQTSVWVQGGNMLGDFLKIITWLADKGYRCYQSGSLDPLWHSSERYGAWFDLVQDLRIKSAHLQNCESHGFTIEQYDFDLHRAIEESTAILRRCTTMGEYEKTTVRKFQEELLKLRENIRGTRAASEPRKTPYSALIYGQSKIGKSSIVDIIESYFALLNKLPLDPRYRFAVNPDANFWDGFESWQWSILLDDIAKVSAKTQEDKSLDAVINCVNNISYMPDKAAVEDKAKCPVKAKLLLATTNTRDLNAWHRFSHPVAIMRRFDIVITPHVRSDCADGVSLRSDLPPQLEGTYPDFWEFDVEQPIVVANSREAGYKMLLNRGSLKDFLLLLRSRILEHNVTQDNYMRCRMNVLTLQLCDRCHMPQGMCLCSQDLQEATEHIEEMQEAWTGPKVAPPSNGKAIGLLDMLTFGIKARTFRRPSYVDNDVDYDMEDDDAVYRDENDNEVQGLEVSTWLPSASQILVGGLAGYGAYTLGNTHGRQLCARMGVAYQRLGTFARNSTILARVAELSGEQQAAQVVRAVRYGVNTVEFWRDLGARAAQEIIRPPVLIAIGVACAALTGGLVIYSFFASCEKANTVEGEMRPPEPREHERPDVWYVSDYPKQKLEISPASRCSSGSNVEGVMQKITRQTYKANFRFQKNGACVDSPCHVFAICSQYLLAAAHTIPIAEEFQMDLVNTSVQGGSSPNYYNIRVKSSQVIRHVEQDLAIIYTPNMRPMSDLRKFLSEDEKPAGLFSGTYIVRNGTSNQERITMHSVSYVQADHPPHPSGKTSSVFQKGELFKGGVGKYWGGVFNDKRTQPGDCGAPFIIQSPSGPTIAGLHNMAGPVDHDREHREGGFATPITLQCVESLIAAVAMRPTMVQSGYDTCHVVSPSLGDIQLGTTKSPFIIGDIHAKSPVRWLKQGNIEAYGSKVGFKTSYKSQVQPTLFADFFKEFGVTTDKVKPDLGWRPFANALADMVNVPNNEDLDVVDLCADELMKDILDGLPEVEKADFHPYDMDTAINGAEGVAYVNPINITTSAGVPWYQCKRNLLVPSGVNSHGDPKYTLNSEAMEMFLALVARYDAGLRGGAVFGSKPKDEPLGEEKAKKGDSRIFQAGPLNLTVLMRMYFLPIIRMIQNNKQLFESGPGTVCQAKEWEELFDYLVQHGADRILAGDYSKYDKRQGAAWILAAFRVIIGIATELGYDDIAIRRMWGVAFDVAYSFSEFDGTLVQFLGTNPSGHALTVIINGLVGSLYMRYCYYFLNPDKEVRTFKQNVALMTYGDDNIAGISRVAPWFHHTAVQMELAKIGVLYTMADKKAESVPYINIAQATFLKRSFVDSEFLFQGRVTKVAPLEMKSLHKTMLVCTRSKTVTVEFQNAQMLVAVHAEMFFHGRRVFDLWDARIRECCTMYRLENYVGTLPTWDGYVKRWVDASLALYPELALE